MVYLLLITSIMVTVVNNYLLHRFNNRGMRGIGDVLLFNTFISIVWFVVLLCVNGSFFIPSKGAVIWGSIYGCVISVFLLSKMQALSNGPISLTTFIGCCSLLVSTTFGIIVWNEKISTFQIIGIIVLIVSLYFAINPKIDIKATKSWKFYCLTFFICSAMIGIVFKFHQSSEYSSEMNEMMIVSSVVSALIFFISSIILSRKKLHSLPRLHRGTIIYIILCGLASCCYNRLNIWLSGQLPSIIFFPVFNGSVILLASIIGLFVFKEKLKKSQIIGIMTGIFAIFLTSGIL